MQRALRHGVFQARGLGQRPSSTAEHSLRAVLSASTVLRSVSALLPFAEPLRNKLFSEGLSRRALPTTAAVPVMGGSNSVAQLSRVQEVAAPDSRRRTFLLVKARKVAPRDTAAVTTAVRAAAALQTQSLRYRELRVYRRRLKLRLPQLEITRHRRRKGGHVAFATNSLKQPKTFAGLRQQFLPPENVKRIIGVDYGDAGIVSSIVYTPTEQYEDRWARY